MMTRYSIKDLERLSGIKAHTLRMWERRYKILMPKRTETNIRYYHDNDLKKLLNISVLNQLGYKISSIAKFTEDELSAKVFSETESCKTETGEIECLKFAILKFDEQTFNNCIDGTIRKYGFIAAFKNVIIPFYAKVGSLWLNGTLSIAQEHFASNLIRQKLFTAIESVKIPPDSNKPKFLLFLPEGEFHESGLLFALYLLKSKAFPVNYIGQSIPLQEVINAYEVQKPEYLMFSITTGLKNDTLEDFLSKLTNQISDKQILISGRYVHEIESMPFNMRVLSSFSEFENFVDRL